MADEKNEEAPNPFGSLKVKELERVQGLLTNMINHMAVRIQYAETRRNTFAVIGGTLAAGGIAIITLGVSQVAFYPLLVAMICFGTVAIATGVTSWIVYARQTNFSYPFLNSEADVKSKKWFYHNALTQVADFDSTIFATLTKKLIQNGKEGFQRQWVTFRDETSAVLVDSKANALDDLRQVYLLHVNERYKNLFLTHLRKIISIGLILGVIFAIIGFFATLGLSKSDGVSSKTYENEIYSATSTWQRTTRVKSDLKFPLQTEVLFNSTIENRTDQELVFRELVARHRNGMQIPMSVELLNPSPIVIKPGSVVPISGILWVPTNLEGDIENFELSK